MSDKTRDLLYLIGGCVAILTGALVVGMFTFAVFNGSVEVPEVTTTNFWGFINFLLISLVIPYLQLRINELKARSLENHRKLQETADVAHEVKERLDNGIKTSLTRIEAATAHDAVPGGKRASDPPHRGRVYDAPED